MVPSPQSIVAVKSLAGAAALALLNVAVAVAVALSCAAMSGNVAGDNWSASATSTESVTAAEVPSFGSVTVTLTASGLPAAVSSEYVCEPLTARMGVGENIKCLSAGVPSPQSIVTSRPFGASGLKN